MVNQNLGSLPKSGNSIRLVLNNFMLITQAEVFMNKSINLCKKHNCEKSIKPSSKKLYCKICANEAAKKHYQIHKDTRKHEAKLLMDSFSNTEIIKICPMHGNLRKADIICKSSRAISCLQCSRISSIKTARKYKEKYGKERREKRKANIEEYRLKERLSKKNYYSQNSNKVKILSKNWRVNNPDKHKSSVLKRNYNITLSEYKILYELQNGLCKICHKSEVAISNYTKKLKELSVDHCHKTGKIRGLLCSKCNCMIGYARESQEILLSAMNYLKEYDNDK